MNLDYAKYRDGLVPVIVQNAASGVILMLGFMNAEAVAATEASRRVTFFSRSKERLWTKGETSGNYLELVSITADCDADTVLVKALPHGPICHNGTDTCFGDPTDFPIDALLALESVIDSRRRQNSQGSHVAKLFRGGLNKIAQKVGEEAVELVIEAKDDDREKLIGEAADLLFHYLVLLRAKGVSVTDVIEELHARRK